MSRGYSAGADVVVVGAGIVGAACAYYAARAGLRSCVLDRGPLAGGTTGAGEGNLLVSDKQPGPELELALLSNSLWRGIGAEDWRSGTVAERIELDAKGGLVVADSDADLAALCRLRGPTAGRGSRRARTCRRPTWRDYEPNLAGRPRRRLCSTRRTCRCSRCSPPRVLLRLARDAGALVLPGADGHRLTAGRRRGSPACAPRAADLAAGAVVNAAGTWAGEVAALAGVHAAGRCRGAGFVLVTEPLPHARAAQGVPRRLRRRRGQRLGGAAVLARGRGRPRPAPCSSAPPASASASTARHRRPRSGRLAAGAVAAVPLPGRRVGAARLPRVPAVLPRPPAGHRPRSAGARAVARLRPRGRGHRAGPGDRSPHRPEPSRATATDLPLHPFRPERFDDGCMSTTTRPCRPSRLRDQLRRPTGPVRRTGGRSARR